MVITESAISQAKEGYTRKMPQINIKVPRYNGCLTYLCIPDMINGSDCWKFITASNPLKLRKYFLIQTIIIIKPDTEMVPPKLIRIGDWLSR